MQFSRLPTTQEGGHGGDGATLPPRFSADEAPLKDQLKVQLYRIYTSVSRQREWFKLHESNMRALAEETETLRARFFPHEQSLLSTTEGNGVIAATSSLPPAAVDGAHFPPDAHVPAAGRDMSLTALRPCGLSSLRPHGEFFPRPAAAHAHENSDGTCGSSDVLLHSAPFEARRCGGAVAALQRVVPEYLLQLTPIWIHERLGGACGGRDSGEGDVSPGEAAAALVALLLPLLRAFHGVLDMARWLIEAGHFSAGILVDKSPVSSDTLCAVFRHLFYLFHEALCCLASCAMPPAGPRSQMVAALPPMSREEREEAAQIFVRLRDSDGNGALMFQLLCANDTRDIASYHAGAATVTTTNTLTTAPVPRRIVQEAFDFLATHYLGMSVGE